MLARTRFGRLLQDFAFGGAGGELTFVAALQKWISPDPLDPSRVFVLRQPPWWGGKADHKTKNGHTF
ncbi:hypothetical protein B1B05_12710 [Domibacillus enclensis]|uniref:Uncharacterized protein n=1 Tax=Domibacillus enclensis TaxID=1017273 RepID=A0ABX4E6E8_9BACI|nr:hypothetical protein B1B05_12710 [Domibacillus enclensis]